MGSECTGFDECGAGAQNSIQPSFCDNCLLRPDTHYCSAGVCVANDPLENVTLTIGGPEALSAAKSVSIASIIPVMADGTRVTCAALTSGCGFLQNSALNTANSRSAMLQALPAMVTRTAIFMRAEPGQILFIQATDDIRGAGNVLGRACIEDVDPTDPSVMSQGVGVDLMPLP